MPFAFLAVKTFKLRHIYADLHSRQQMVQFTGEAYSEGVEIVERDQVQLRFYSVAKTVADCF